MLSFELSFKKLEFNISRFKKDFQAALQDEVLEGTRAALKVIVERIPVYTGEARGTLKPIGRFLNEEIPIEPVARRKGHDADSGDRQSSVELTLDTPYNPGVKVNIELFHVRWNEFNASPLPLTHPTPWHAFEAGRKAFQIYMKENLKKNLPKILSYRTNATLEGNPNG